MKKTLRNFFHSSFVLLFLISSNLEAQDLRIISSGETSPGTNWTVTGSSPVVIAFSNTANIAPSVINTYLDNGQSVQIQGAGNVIIDDNITKAAGASTSLTIKSEATIQFNASKSVTSTTGALDVVLWVNADGGTSNGSVLFFSGAGVATNGGHLWVGGGSGSTTWNGLTVGNGYAVAPTTSIAYIGALAPFAPGIYLYGVNINTNGGNLAMYGSAQVNTASGSDLLASLVSVGNTSVTTGTGTIKIVGNSTVSNARGFLTGPHHTSFNCSFIASSSSNTQPAIDWDIRTTATAQQSLIAEGATTLQATGTGGISLLARTSDASTTHFGIRVPGSSDFNVVSFSGGITVDGGLRGISVTGNSMNVGYQSGTSVSSSTANVTMKYGAAAGTLNVRTTGGLTIDPLNTSISIGSVPAITGISALTIGTSTNTGNVTISSARTVAGPITLYGTNLTISSALTATSSNIYLYATGAVSQSAAITGSGLALYNGGSFTLTNTSNQFQTIAGGTSASRIGALSFKNNGPFTVGTVNPTGIYSSGEVNLASLAGDNITISEPINTTSTSSNAIRVFADQGTAAGTGTGGQILVSGNGAVATGTNGYVKLFSGSQSSSTGLSSLATSSSYLISNKASSESETVSTPTPGVYVIYRDAAALPVTWLSFSAKKQMNGVELNWSTASEQNNLYFEMERSADGRSFIAIGKVAGSGNSFTRKDYRYMDNANVGRKSYYRIKQVDADGKFQYSAIVSVSDISEVRMWADATSKSIHIDLPENGTTYAELVITDANGRQLVRRQLSAGSTNIPLSSFHFSGTVIAAVFDRGERIAVARFMQ